jgi:hypothetical protein
MLPWGPRLCSSPWAIRHRLPRRSTLFPRRPLAGSPDPGPGQHGTGAQVLAVAGHDVGGCCTTRTNILKTGSDALSPGEYPAIPGRGARRQAQGMPIVLAGVITRCGGVATGPESSAYSCVTTRWTSPRRKAPLDRFRTGVAVSQKRSSGTSSRRNHWTHLRRRANRPACRWLPQDLRSDPRIRYATRFRNRCALSIPPRSCSHLSILGAIHGGRRPSRDIRSYSWCRRILSR